MGSRCHLNQVQEPKYPADCLGIEDEEEIGFCKEYWLQCDKDYYSLGCPGYKEPLNSEFNNTVIDTSLCSRYGFGDTEEELADCSEVLNKCSIDEFKKNPKGDGRCDDDGDC